jgi:hypothetical protein
MKLYVKDIVREPKDTLYSFLYKVLRLDHNYHIQTTVNTTYYYPDFTNMQCINGKNRSFDDLVIISKTYFRVSDKSVAKVIKKLLDGNNNLIFVLCDSVNKWVLNRSLTKSESIKYCARYNISDHKTEQFGAGDYSFDTIITLMGLTKEDVKIEYE